MTSNEQQNTCETQVQVSPNERIGRINEGVKSLVEDIRAYVREQVLLWQIIPGLLLEAQGKPDGYGREYLSYVCYHKCLPIYIPGDRNTAAYVYLNTGELVMSAVEVDFDDPQTQRRILAPDIAVFNLTPYIQYLDATSYVENLIEAARSPSNEEEESWIEMIAGLSNIQRIDIPEVQKTLERYKREQLAE